jgi:hypothetical protein
MVGGSQRAELCPHQPMVHWMADTFSLRPCESVTHWEVALCSAREGYLWEVPHHGSYQKSVTRGDVLGSLPLGNGVGPTGRCAFGELHTRT